MILDLPRFLDAEHKYWDELKAMLAKLDDDPSMRLTLEQASRLHYLYQRAGSALARLSTFSSEDETKEYLESLVARAYAECHPHRSNAGRFNPFRWFFRSFPQTFRRHSSAFLLALGLTVGGAIFGAGALAFDQTAKPVLMPFQQLDESPAQRVAREEGAKTDRLAGRKGSFSAQLMTHNIQVSLLTFALGTTWGIGSILLLFYNGVTLGAVCFDYAHAGYSQFLMGWLLPHGVIEIPAILIAGQAGFVLASALIGWRASAHRMLRLRALSGDMLTLAGGAAVMLVWAGVIESFFSQYHYPVLPYSLKIAFGLVELTALIVFLLRAGRA